MIHQIHQEFQSLIEIYFNNLHRPSIIITLRFIQTLRCISASKELRPRTLEAPGRTVWERDYPIQGGTADFSSVRIFCDCVKRSVASSMVLCTTETIQMGSPQQLEST